MAVDPAGKAYEVHYTADANFDSFLAQVAVANAAVDSMKENADAANKDNASSSKLVTDAEKAKSDAFKQSAASAITAANAQQLLNKQNNNGFNTAQESKNFLDQLTQSQQKYNLAKNNGRSTADQVVADIRNQTAAITDSNKAIDQTTTSLGKATKAHTDASKATDKTADSWKNLWGASKFLKLGLDSLAQDFERLAVLSKSEGGSGGGLSGILGGIGGAANSGIASALSGLGSLAGAIAPVLAFSVAIPTLVSGVAGLGAAFVGLIGALSPLVGIFATFLPIMLGMGEAAAVLVIGLKPVVTAITDLNSSSTKLQATGKKMVAGFSEPMQAAVKDIQSFIKALKDSGLSAKDLGSNILAPLVSPGGALTKLPEVIKPIVAALKTMSYAVGDFIDDALTNLEHFLTSPGFITVSDAATKGLDIFGTTLYHILDIIEELAVVASPYMVKLAKMFSDLFTGIDKDLNGAVKSGSVKDFFDQMIIALQEVGTIGYQILRVFDLWGSGLAPVGNFILTGIGTSLGHIADAAEKVNFSKWNKDLDIFLHGISTATSGIAGLFGALVKPEFVAFLGDVLDDVGKIAKALKPIVAFFADIVAGSLPQFKKLLDEITNIAIGDVIKPLADFFGMLEKHPEIMKGLSTLFTAMAGLVVSASLISTLSKLKDLASAKWSGLIDMLNKIPGVNLPGGGTAATTDATALKGSATSLTEAATALKGAATDLKGGSVSEGASGAEAGAAGGATGAAEGVSIGVLGTIVTAVVGLLVLGAGAALIAYLVHGATDPKSQLAKANDRVTTDVLGPSNHQNVVGRVSSDINQANKDFFTGQTQWQQSWHKAIANAGTDISNFFSGNAQWEKDGNKALTNFFTGSNQWQKAANAAISNFFTGSIPHWLSSFGGVFMRSVGTPISNFATNTAPGFFTKTIPHWFDSFMGTLNRNVVNPVSTAVTKTIPGFFTQTVPHWFDAAVGAFNSRVLSPLNNWVTKTIPGFFTQTVPHWFDSAVAAFTAHVLNPVNNWVTNTIPSFFTKTVPHWFDDAVAAFTTHVLNPVSTAVTKTIPNFFTSTIPHWFESVPSFITSKVIDPLKNYFTGTGSNSLLGDLKSGFTNAINAVISTVFNNGIIRLINDAITVVGIPKIPNIPKLATGGHVPGNTSESDTSDSMLARLTPGEFVVRKRAAQHLGPNFLSAINNADTNGIGRQLRGYANGGLATGLPDPTGGLGGTGITTQQAQNVNQSEVTGTSSWGALTGIANWAKGLVKGALRATFDTGWNTIVNPVLKGLGSTIPAGGVQSMGAGLKAGIDTLLGAQDKKYNASIGGVIPSADHKSIIDQALKAAGVAQSGWPTWEAGLNTLITRESAWNASAVNNTDSNAAAGTPSEGLAQVIQPTFDAYHVAGTSENLKDPVANVAAAIKYIESRYGGIQNVQQANANMPPKGYAAGGFAGGMTSGMGFASMPGFAGGGTVGVDKPTGSSMSTAGANANGGRSGPGVAIENFNVHNALPERVTESLSSMMNRVRVYGAHNQ